ncbi:MAG: arginine--tRNA ligase [Candidatus Ancaeobacter aquaticus]|nr:arginine--tRNA ligase [Candidatus Ancaeobacter aquaticus]
MNKVITEIIISSLKNTLNQMCSDSGISPETLPDILLETPSDKQFGDISTNCALQLARTFKNAPPKIALGIKEALDNDPALSDTVQEIKIAGPGFINFYLTQHACHIMLRTIHEQEKDYGRVNVGKGKKVMVEFVSANPTGPLTVAHGRQAAVGDTLSHILSFAGYDVTREYLINDRGKQIHILGLSVYARYKEKLGKGDSFPEDGYKGAYIYDIAQSIIDKDGNKYLNSTQEDVIPYFMEYASNTILEDIKHDLTEFNVRFDSWFSEKKFAQTTKIEAVLETLREKKLTYTDEGALWFRSTQYGDDKDRVLIKNTGDMTYITPDIAYHDDKCKRGYEMLINLWGPDHHGYIQRLKASLTALGYDENILTVVIVQLATLFQGDTRLSMSTRAGEFISLREVIDEVGVDSARYFFVRRKTDSHLDFDLELAKKQSSDNPVYYVQYAHARISSIFKKAREEKGIYITKELLQNARLELLNEPEALDLLKFLGRFEDIVGIAADKLESHWIPLYLEDLASKMHVFYTRCRVLSDDEELTLARLTLIDAARIVIANGLHLLGVKAPCRM